MQPAPFVREAGSGPSAICLHTSAGSSAQWRSLMEALSPSFHVIAPDFYGDGKSPPVRTDKVFSEEDEVELLQPLLDASAPFHLIGHSYGGAIAAWIALSQPDKVRSLILYEPALWGMLETNWPGEAGTREIASVRDALMTGVAAGDVDGASEGFIDYWMGEGSWARTPIERRPAMASGCTACAFKWRRWLSFPLHVSRLPSLPRDILLLTGSQTTEAAKSVVRHLREHVPNARVVVLDGPGHMGPITHAHLVNHEIQKFLVALGQDVR